MRVKKAKSSLVFAVENFVNGKSITVHAQNMITYSVRKRDGHLLAQLQEKAIHYSATYHLLDKIGGIRK